MECYSTLLQWMVMDGNLDYRPTVQSSGPVIQRLQVRFLREHNFFALLVLSSRCSGVSSLGLRAGSLRTEARKTIKHLKLWPANVKNILIDLLLKWLLSSHVIALSSQID